VRDLDCGEPAAGQEEGEAVRIVVGVVVESGDVVVVVDAERLVVGQFKFIPVALAEGR
jgi:hypothetical protein